MTAAAEGGVTDGDERRLIADFIVSVTDRREELDGETWRAARRGRAAGEERNAGAIPFAFRRLDRTAPLRAVAIGPPLPPRRLDAPGGLDPLILDPFARISQILRYAAMPLRWEPGNVVAGHRGVPTGGGSYAVDVRLVARNGAARRAMRLAPDAQALVVEEEAACAGPPGTEILLAGAPARVQGMYGDFGLQLILFEAGAILAQVTLCAAALGVPVRAEAAGEAARADGTVALARLRLDDGGAMAGAPAAATPVPAEPASAAPGGQLRPMLRLIELRDGQGQAAVRPWSGPPALPLFDAAWRRTSGAYGGVVAEDAGPALLQALADSAAALADAWSGAWNDALDLHAIVWRGRAAPAAVMRVERGGRVTDAGPLPAEAAPLRGKAAQLSLVIGCPVDSLTADGAGYRDMHLAAGALMQCLSLAAATRRRWARPLRQPPDRLLNLLKPLDRRALMQIDVGANGLPVPAFPLA